MFQISTLFGTSFPLVKTAPKVRDKSEKALLSFVFRITKFRISQIENLLKGKATKVIVALEKMN